MDVNEHDRLMLHLDTN